MSGQPLSLYELGPVQLADQAVIVKVRGTLMHSGTDIDFIKISRWDSVCELYVVLPSAIAYWVKFFFFFVESERGGVSGMRHECNNHDD